MRNLALSAVLLSTLLAFFGCPFGAFASESKILSILKNKDPWRGSLIHRGTRVEDLRELIIVAKEGRLEEMCPEEDAEAIARLAIKLARMGFLEGDPYEIKDKADILEKLLDQGSRKKS